MSTPWKLYNEVSKNNNLNYSVYRCPDPVAIKTQDPWYPISNICPCNPELSAKTGRGYVACPMGLELEKRGKLLPMSQIINQIPKEQQIVGNLYNESQYVPPQMDPRPMAEIGYQWRSGN